ncbi:MAG: glutathione S-transferase family protein [Pseudomonadota bacterium]
MYRVIGTHKSRAFRVLWALEELGEPYVHEPHPPRSDAVMAVNPSGKIPVLVFGDQILTDSVAIMAYLADKHGALTFPPGTVRRAQLDAVVYTLLESFDATLWAASQHKFILPKALRLPELRPALEYQLEHAQQDLIQHLGDAPFLMGDTFTIADILAGHCGNWATSTRFKIDPRFGDYLERLRARPAHTRVMAL